MKGIAATQRTKEAIRSADQIKKSRGLHKSRKGSLPLSGAAGTTEYFAEIQSGTDRTYTVNIYDRFASDMSFTDITPLYTGVTAEVVPGMLNDGFDLASGSVFMVSQYPVSDGEEPEAFVDTWILTTRPGAS